MIKYRNVVDNRIDPPITWSFHGIVPVADVGLVEIGSVVPCALVFVTLLSCGPAPCEGAVPARICSVSVEKGKAFCASR